jgi:AcrR family transcriptional regulator
MRMATRLTAEERREEVVAAASTEFAATGYAGTATDSIARRAGVSQPYLFQLFGTKRDLFIAAVEDCFERTSRSFEDTGKRARAAGLSPNRILEQMGHGYIRLLQADPNVLRLQLQAYAACNDAEVRRSVRRSYKALWQTAAEQSGADQAGLRDFFAMGMLINVVASIGEGASFEDYLDSLLGGLPDICPD